MAKIIAITGAGDGLGRALARRFAKDGDTVILLGRTLAKVQAVADELGAPAVAIQCDIADGPSVTAAFAAIAKLHPKIDVLINNAGIYWPFTLDEARDDLVENLTAININGTIFCGREALKLFDGGGHIINVTSESAALKTPMMWLYAATKQAVELIGEMWGRELEPAGVRVTTVRCGQMMDETKTAAPWPVEVSMKFGAAAAVAGINLREKPISHFNSVAQAFRAVVDMPRDMHINFVGINGARKD